MKPFICIALLISLATTAVSGQDFFPLKRKPYLLTVAVDKKSTYEENLPEAPFVLPDQTVQIYPGETVFIEIEQEGGVVKNVKAVTENKFPHKTLVITFTQIVKKKIHQAVMLKIDNPFDYVLRYDAKTYLLNYKTWVNAKVLAVQPGLSAYETWPEVITSVALGSWSFGKQ